VNSPQHTQEPTQSQQSAARRGTGRDDGGCVAKVTRRPAADDGPGREPDVAAAVTGQVCEVQC
jgi:hypothetical protein